MQDIDFDELDRAVSSTMNGKPAPAPKEETVSVNVTSKSPRNPAPRPSSGRFMDVVHPSSDMRSGAPERSKPRAPEPPEPTRSEPSHHDWPDPIDFQGFKDEPKEELEEKPVINEAKTPVEPLDSPFLSDAKVEKRPLGAFSDTIPEKAEEKDEPELLLEAPDEELLPATTETKEEEPVSEDEPTPAPEPEKEPEPKPEPEPVNVPASITQQYKEQPSTTDQPSGAIYDTESYHQPLAHPAKKSGALVVVWILLLILLGGGIGAAVYFFVLPML